VYNGFVGTAHVNSFFFFPALEFVFFVCLKEGAAFPLFFATPCVALIPLHSHKKHNQQRAPMNVHFLLVSKKEQIQGRVVCFLALQELGLALYAPYRRPRIAPPPPPPPFSVALRSVPFL
jgi:hypothetical protein